MIRHNRMGIVYELIEVSKVRTMIKLGDKSIIVDAPIDMIDNAWFKWTINGKMIQDAFPFLDIDEREFLMTGILPDEWDELFGEGEK